MIDFGDDALTQGRAHPMIDTSLRNRHLAELLADPDTAVVLLDVLLGHGSHPDPAAELLPALDGAGGAGGGESDRGAPRSPAAGSLGTAAAPGRGLGVHLQRGRHPARPQPAQPARPAMADDPLSPDARQPAATHRWVPTPSSRAACHRRLQRLTGAAPRVVTAGVSLFAESVAAQAVAVTEVDWRPPLPGTAADLARVMADPRRRPAQRRGARAGCFGAEADAGRRAPAGEALGLATGDVPARRAADRVGPRVRAAARGADRRAAVRGRRATPRGCRAAVRRRRRLRPGPVPPPRRRRPDGRRRVAVDVGVRAARPGHGRRACCTLNEGLGKVLRYGAYSEEVIERLRWMSRVLGPLLQTAVRRHGPVDLKAIVGPDAADGRRGPQPQPGRHADAAARAAARADRLRGAVGRGRRGGPVHGRQRPLLPQPRRCRPAS